MEVEHPPTIEDIKARQEELRRDLEKMMDTLEDKLRVNVMGHVTALLMLGILEGRMTSHL